MLELLQTYDSCTAENYFCFTVTALHIFHYYTFTIHLYLSNVRSYILLYYSEIPLVCSLCSSRAPHHEKNYATLVTVTIGIQTAHMSLH